MKTYSTFTLKKKKTFVRFTFISASNRAFFYFFIFLFDIHRRSCKRVEIYFSQLDFARANGARNITLCEPTFCNLMPIYHALPCECNFRLIHRIFPTRCPANWRFHGQSNRSVLAFLFGRVQDLIFIYIQIYVNIILYTNIYNIY